MQRVTAVAASLLLASGLLFYGSRLASRVAETPTDFVHFESAHVHPAALSPDGSHLFVVNTPDMRLSVFSLASGTPVLEKEISVGLEPVSVTASTNGEVWVVNHLSDDISIVDVNAGNVIRTLRVGDEPTDVAFAGTTGGLRAFVCVSQEDSVKVYDPANLSGPPQAIAIPGSDPHALAVNDDRTEVYVTVLEAGNKTTVVDFKEVMAGGGVPPAVPTTDPALPDSPNVALIVKRVGGHWVDEIGRNWDLAAPYTVVDNGLVVLNANSRTITASAQGVGTLNFNAAWNRANGKVYVTNTDALNHVRFEPNLRGRFVRNRVSIVNPANTAVVDTVHLNKHINYAVAQGPQSEIDQSLSQPCDIAWDSTGSKAYIAAFGSGLLGVIDATGNVVNRVAVGGGPSGVAIDRARRKIYVVNRFDNTISIVDQASELQTAVVPIGKSGFDPTPSDVKQGRAFQYDGHLTSAHGDLACASCHAFTHFDNIAWDLGDPRGRYITTSDPEFPDGQLDPLLEGFHPLKGPMTTQSLRGLATTEPLHWRGDRIDLNRFNPAFQGLLGNDRQLTSGELALYNAFIMSVHYPPNPNQNLDRTYPNPSSGPSAQRGFDTFLHDRHDGLFECVTCHIQFTGTNGQIINDQALQEDQDIKVPQLRDLYEKTGFRDSIGAVNRRGFGFTHDGSVDNLFTFLKLPVFQFAGGDAQRRDMEAFLLAFDTGTPPIVGLQVTVNGTNKSDPSVVANLNLMVSQFNDGNCDVIVKGPPVNGEQRGYVLQIGNVFQPDRESEPTLTVDELRNLAGNGNELTWTAVPGGTGTRAGVDRDRDGHADRDEIDAGSDPADPNSMPSVAVEPRVPTRLSFAGASPNPFRRTTEFGFRLPAAGQVRLALYDLRGREVRVLVNERYPEGEHVVPFDGRDARGVQLGAGIYFARFDFGGRSAKRPLVLIR